MNDEGLRAAVEESLAANWFCTIATSSRMNRPHVAGVLYDFIGRHLYVNTDMVSRKARNIAGNGRAAVCVAVDRFPGGPPSTVSFQGTAALIPNDHVDIARLVSVGHLRTITSHGELERPGTCMIRITPVGRVFTYGIGISDEQFEADPLNASGSVAW